ncbi:MAG: hypothetical protein Q9183_004300 [Haloplaca sp. 2 TL-2023]
MSGPRRTSYNGLPLSNPAGTNPFQGFDFHGNGLINPQSFGTVQPNFAPTWSEAPGWMMPLTNYNFLQTGFAPNQTIFPNHQGDEPLQGNDDFYADDSTGKTNAIKANHDQRGPENLLPRKRTAEPSDQDLAFPNNLGETETKITTSSALSKSDATNRAAELRARLLASKRPDSATPTAHPGSVTPDGKPGDPTLAKEKKAALKEVSTQPTKDSKANPISSAAKPVMTKPVDKSANAPPNVPNPSPANADIEGLLGEYRRPKPASAIKVKLPPMTNTDANKPKSSVKATKDAPGNALHNSNARVPGSPTPVTSRRKQQGSLGSPESGEIHSDEELSNSGPGKDKSAQSRDMNTKGVPADGAELSTAIDSRPGKAVKAIQGPRNELRPISIDPSSSRSTLARNTGQHPRQSSSAPRQMSQDHETRRLSRGRERSRSPRRARDISPRRASDRIQHEGVKDRTQVPTSTSTEMRRSGRLPMADDGRSKVTAEHKRDSLDKPAETKKSQPMQSNTQPSQEQASPTGTALTNGQVVTVPVKATLDRPAPATNEGSHHTTSNGSNGAGVNSPVGYTLNHAQHEQMQKLGLELSPNGLGDLFDFLEFHGFHNEEYRAVVVEEHRGLKAIKEQQKALEEKQLAAERKVHDQFQSMRAQSQALREATEPPTPTQHKDLIQPSAVSSIRPMLPPLTLPKRPEQARMNNTDGRDGRDSIVPTSSPAVHTPRSQVASATKPISTKREQAEEDNDHGPSRKFSRIDYDRTCHERSPEVSPRTSRKADHQASAEGLEARTEEIMQHQAILPGTIPGETRLFEIIGESLMSHDQGPRRKDVTFVTAVVILQLRVRMDRREAVPIPIPWSPAIHTNIVQRTNLTLTIRMHSCRFEVGLEVVGPDTRLTMRDGALQSTETALRGLQSFTEAARA